MSEGGQATVADIRYVYNNLGRSRSLGTNVPPKWQVVQLFMYNEWVPEGVLAALFPVVGTLC